MIISLCLFTAFLVFMAITSYRRHRATTAWLITQAEQQRETTELSQRLEQLNLDIGVYREALVELIAVGGELAAERDHLSTQLGLDPHPEGTLPCLRLVTNDDGMEN
jgi:hypothetical protein